MSECNNKNFMALLRATKLHEESVCFVAPWAQAKGKVDLHHPKTFQHVAFHPTFQWLKCR